jgi:acyl-CoA reductase-like NAD-dependent aldehyde dehydrogenase
VLTNMIRTLAYSNTAAPLPLNQKSEWYFPLTSGYEVIQPSEDFRQYILLDAEAKVKTPSLYAVESEINRRAGRDLEGLPVAARWDIVSDADLGALIKSQLRAAQQATLELRQIPLKTRIEVLKVFGDRLRNQHEKWRVLTVQESYAYNAFLVSLDAVLEIFQPSYFDFIEGILQPVWKSGSGARLEHVPYGVVGVISPQNSSFPMLTQVLHGAFLAGNALLIKPPHRLAVVALALVEEFNRVLKDCGMPNHLVSTVIHPNTSKILEHWLGERHGSGRINNLVFIGNSKRRDDILATCQKSGLFNPIVELEGVDAAYVHGDLTDELLQKYARLVAHAKNAGSGQFCVSLKRLYVHPEVYEPFMNYLRAAFKQYQPGSLHLNSPYVLGPSSLPQKLPSIVAAFEQAGARVGLGGRRLNYKGEVDPDGIYIEPTLFEDVSPDCELIQSEIFANVLPVIKTSQCLKETIDQLNYSNFGIRTSIFAQDLDVINQLRHALHVGTVVINGNPLDFSLQIAGGRGDSTLDQNARLWPIDLSVRQVVAEGRGIRSLEEILGTPSNRPRPSLEGRKAQAPDRR